MNSFSLTRKYKDKSPLETIENARSVLNSIGLLLFEQIWFTPQDSLVSATIVTDQKYGSFYSNGKGRSKDYCLASAYGEFLERLQNNTHLLSIPQRLYASMKAEFGFFSYPDEVFLNETDLESLPRKILEDLFGINGGFREYYKLARENNGQGCLSVPFFDVRNRTQIYIPYNSLLSLTGSNGMSAGNSASEAICQAIFELFERWAAARVFFERLTPPNILENNLKECEQELRIIKQIEDHGLDVSVKDFSCGAGLPVVGLIISDSKYSNYFLNIGCDSSFQVALSRCLTEIYQGVGSIERIRERMMKIPSSNEADILEETLLCELAKFYTDGSGQFPPELFQNNPSYDVDLSGFDCKSNFQLECAHWLSYLLNLGYEVYIRDVSFLGFPSYHVYVPGISKPLPERYERPVDYRKMRRLERAIEICFDLKARKEIDDQELLAIEDAFREMDYNEKVTSVCGIELEDCPIARSRQLSVGNFLAVLCILRNDPEKAIKILTEHKAVVNDDYAYKLSKKLESVAGFMQNADRSGRDSAKRIAQSPITDSLAAYILNSRRGMHKVIKQLGLPTCPDCNSCFWNDCCLTRGRLKLTSIIYPAYLQNSNMVSQLSIGKDIEKYCKC